ncbi:hypothetical protein [Agarivorans sp.]|uniref:hypothetical protein n=1 Tax=Agarivorans sp. TaxID=1872412 RepID=UPI003CFF16B0
MLGNIMNKAGVSLLVLLSPWAHALDCSTQGFAEASALNRQSHAKVQQLSKQYVELCSWQFNLPKQQSCQLFKDKKKQFEQVNNRQLEAVLVAANAAAEAWYQVHEACAATGKRENSSNAFQAYEKSFSAYQQLISVVEQQYQQQCYPQLQANIKQYCN